VAQNTRKKISGRGSAPDPAGGACSAPPGPLAGGEGACCPTHSRPSASIFGPSVLPPNEKILIRPCAFSDLWTDVNSAAAPVRRAMAFIYESAKSGDNCDIH